MLSKEEREETQQLLNKAVRQRLNTNIEKKQNRALKKTEKMFGRIKDEKLARRVKDTYIEDNDKLTDTLINTGAKNIKNKIKKTKIEKPTNSNSAI